MSDAKKQNDKPSFERCESFELLYFTLVDRCPYCGSKFDEDGTTIDGKPCSHPTKMRNGFGAAGGSGPRVV